MINLLRYVLSAPSANGCFLTLEVEMALLDFFREEVIPLWTGLALYDATLPRNTATCFKTVSSGEQRQEVM